MRYVLGIDGGGTKTLAVITDEAGKVAGCSQGGPSNYDDIGIERARDNIRECVARASARAGHASPPFAAAFLGMAGVVSERDRAAIRSVAHSLELAADAHIGIDHDCRAALAGGLLGSPGIVVIAGTGSSVYGRNAHGDDWRAGGWGALVSDEGSAYSLGVAAIRSAVRSYDGRIPHSLLEESVLLRLGLSHMLDVMHRIYVQALSRAEIASLAPLVVDATLAGDDAALNIIRVGTAELADCVRAVARRLNLEGARVAVTGGMFSAGPIYREPFDSALKSRLPDCQTVSPRLPAVLGDALLALELLGIPISEAVKHNLAEGARSIV